jgi:hypothetical protein
MLAVTRTWSPLGSVHRLGQRGLEPRRERRDLVGIAGVLEDDGELVPAHAGRQVGGADALAQAAGDLDQHDVARLVAVGVVDRLEVVEVQHQQAHRDPASPGSGEGLLEPVGEGAAVGQARQRVVVGPVDDLRLQGLALGDVPGVEDVLVAARMRPTDPGLHLAHLARGVVEPVREPDSGRQVAFEGRAQHVAAVLLHDQVEDAASDQLLRLVAVHLGGGLVDHREAALGVELRDDVGGALEDGGEPGLAVRDLADQPGPVLGQRDLLDEAAQHVRQRVVRRPGAGQAEHGLGTVRTGQRDVHEPLMARLESEALLQRR